MKQRKKRKQPPYGYRYYNGDYNTYSCGHVKRGNGFLRFKNKHEGYAGFDPDRRRFIVTPAGDLAPKRKIRGTWRWYSYQHYFGSSYDLRFFRWRYI